MLFSRIVWIYLRTRIQNQDLCGELHADTCSEADETSRLVKSCTSAFWCSGALTETHTRTHTQRSTQGQSMQTERAERRWEEEWRREWRRDRQTESEKRWACSRLVLLLPLGNGALRTISARRANSASAVSYKIHLCDSGGGGRGRRRREGAHTKRRERFASKVMTKPLPHEACALLCGYITPVQSR